MLVGSSRLPPTVTRVVTTGAGETAAAAAGRWVSRTAQEDSASMIVGRASDFFSTCLVILEFTIVSPIEQEPLFRSMTWVSGCLKFHRIHTEYGGQHSNCYATNSDGQKKNQCRLQGRYQCRHLIADIIIKGPC